LIKNDIRRPVIAYSGIFRKV